MKEKAQAQFFRVNTEVIKRGALKAMTNADKAVYMVLAMHANWTTGKCWPSYRTIRKLSGCSMTSIAESVKRLRKLGMISYERTKASKGIINTYTVFRNPAFSPEGCSSATDNPRLNQKRDTKGHFQGEGAPARRNTPAPERRNTPCSSATDGNDINSLNDSKGTRSKSSPQPAPRLIITDSTIREILKTKTEEEVRAMLDRGGYPVPEFLLGAKKSPAIPKTEPDPKSVPVTVTPAALKLKPLSLAVAYAIKAELKAGKSATAIKTALVAAGWDPSTVVWPEAS